VSTDFNDDGSFAINLVDLIQQSKIFQGIGREACERLLPRLEKLSLKQGEILFKEGDSSDCLYILADGQLMAVLTTPEGKQKIVGIIEKGETVGELGALSNQPRSVTIRAATNCHILKFPQKEFEWFSKEYPSFVSHIINLIINRSQNTLKLISQKKLYQHIIIIKGYEQAPIDLFMQKLIENFADDPKFQLLKIIPPNINLALVIEEAESQNKNVIFELEENRFNELQHKLNHIGGIFVIVNGDKPRYLSKFALKMLNRTQTPFCNQYELVLLHADNIKIPQATSTWLNQASFTLHHHLRNNDNADYLRLLRFMFGKAIGLVLGGGGNKGWVDIGVIKALLDKNIPIDAIGGASVGAIVGACFNHGQSYEKTFSNFKYLVEATSHLFSFKNLTWPLISLISGKKSTEALHTVFENILIEDLWRPYFSLACNLSTGKEVLHTRGLLWEKLRATAALPGVVPPLVIDGELYCDGGVLNNLPVDCMRPLLGNESTIIAVSLMGHNEHIIHYNFPPIVPFRIGLMKKLRLGYKEYTFPPFFSTFLQALLLGSSSKERANQLAADIIIQPDLSGFRTLDVNVVKINDMIEIGYDSMIEQLEHPIFKSINSRI
jgi:NTE family protein